MSASDDMINLQHQVDRHEGDLDQQLRSIQEVERQNEDLREDVRLSVLQINRLRNFVLVNADGEVQRNALREFDISLQQMRDKYGIEPTVLPPIKRTRKFG